MQLKAFFTFGLVGSAIAASPILDAMDAINKAIGTMTEAVTKWDGADVAAGASILNTSTDLLNVIKGATRNIKAMPGAPGTPEEQIPLNEAVKILPVSNSLTKATTAVIDALIAKKDTIKAKQPDFISVIQGTLNDFKAESNSLLTAIKARLPTNVKSVGDTIGKTINKELDRGIQSYAA